MIKAYLNLEVREDRRKIVIILPSDIDASEIEVKISNKIKEIRK